jgi:4-amino-4-deoxy-L-arabinose transferase-like glycosyltransferase
MTNKPRVNDRFIIIVGLVVLLLAWWVRLTHFNELRDISPDFLENKPFCGLDANAYQTYALGILEGTWPGAQPFRHMILYPFYLSTIYTLVGVNLRIAVIIQILLEIVACATLYGIGRLTFNKWVGLIASILFAFYAPLVFYNPCFAQVALTIPSFTLTIFLLLKAQATGKLIFFSLAGITTALAALSRPTFLILVPIALLWLLFHNRASWRRLPLQLIVYLGIVFLLMLPVALHNYRTAGRFSPTPITGWEIFFVGNNPVAEGMGTLDYVLYAYLDLPGEQYLASVVKDEKQMDVAFRDEALKFITTNPVRWLNLLGRKTYLLLGESDDRLIPPYFLHNLQTTPILQYLPLGWRSIFIGALLGILLLKHKHRSLLLTLLVVLVLSTILFHIQFRFRLFLVPLTLLYTAALVVAAPRLGRLRLMLVLIFLASLYPFLPEVGWLLALLVISALWPYLRHREWQRLGWFALAIWSYLVVATLLHQIITFATRTEQRQAIFLGPQVAGPVALGQSFKIHCAGFNQVSLVLGTFGDDHNYPVTFHLRSERDSPDDIYQVTFDVTKAKDRTHHNFTFPPQTDSAGQSYFFFIDAPLTPLIEAITLRGAYDQPFDRYRDGSAYVGQPGAWQRLPGDIAFRARCDINPLAMTNQTFQKLATDTFGSPIFYWSLLITHAALLIIALYKLQKLTNPSNSIS